jgi:hypothetical protein
MPPLAAALTVGYAFAFGVLMYLTLRATGNLVWPILVHGLYDPTLFLATGGIDRTATGGPASPFLALAAPANLVSIATGQLLLEGIELAPAIHRGHPGASTAGTSA